ncbi:hypothetical protein [Priestia koreensis]|uniref:hypothetical protein n=1 Tax=Priestia koreensis TaxID=284581 RepID=UPI00203F4F88|nr:hypothetical protein [Priestia koreensis]MCM3004947.1 hypothetical protein [Priestia koreensis]
MSKEHAQKTMKVISPLIRIGGIVLLLVAAGMFAVTIYRFGTGAGGIRVLKGLNKNVGTLAEIIGITTGVLWLLRHIWLQMKKRKIPFVEWAQQLYLLLRTHHIFLGIVTLCLGFAHGLYFFIFQTDEKLTMYTGITTFLALVVLALLGWNHHAKKKTKKNLVTKKQHMIMAIIFGILFLIHLNV